MALPEAASQQYIDDLANRPESRPRLAIIVPFRDLDPSQNRQSHLDRFVPHMLHYMAQHAEGELRKFKIFIIEQQLDDGRKFNRGKLLNFGAVAAAREGYDTLVFHDVDLLPKHECMAKWYFLRPRPASVHHMARCWARYNQSQTYLGGIVSMRTEDFFRLQGFPNVYWGWGGEDDELSKRVREHGLRVFAPMPPPAPAKQEGDEEEEEAAVVQEDPGWILDLEEMDLTAKLTWLRANSEVKCGIKYEVNDLHDAVRERYYSTGGGVWPMWWGVNNGGLSMSHELRRVELSGDRAVKITVHLGLNYDGTTGEEHWTNSKLVTTPASTPPTAPSLPPLPLPLPPQMYPPYYHHEQQPPQVMYRSPPLHYPPPPPPLPHYPPPQHYQS